jgi:hypothetical protein
MCQQRNEDAIYRSATMTKPTIAVAMLLLYEEGKWQLDGLVMKFIPEFADLQVLKDGKLIPLDCPMTMRDLMASSAGFAFGPALGSSNPKADEMYTAADPWSSTNDDIIPKLAKLPLEAQPGTEFRYGIQQQVQGAILRRITGMGLRFSWAQVVAEYVCMRSGRITSLTGNLLLINSSARFRGNSIDSVPRRSTSQGTTARLRWPARSTARTAKITLSLEMGTVTVTWAPSACGATFWENCQSGALVSRHSSS